jgi:hypothetical protein
MDAPKDPRAKEQLRSLNPVAIKAGQKEVNAPEHETWGTVSCDQCGEKFYVGPNRIYPEEPDHFIKVLEQMLADDHKRGIVHRNSYEFGW